MSQNPVLNNEKQLKKGKQNARQDYRTLGMGRILLTVVLHRGRAPAQDRS